MVDCKCAPEGKSELSPKYIAIDLEIKRRLTHKYEGGQSL
jgi:hypothetical protein